MKVRISLSKGFFPLLSFSLLIILCLAGCAEDSSILDNGQSRQLEFSVTTHGWNNSNSNSTNFKKNSRATPISGNTFDTSKSFNVIADVNKGGNWSTEVDNETASYSTVNNIWQTTATHYWPGAGTTVNFYAYYPTSISGSITHTAGSVPVLSYTVPDNAADQIDILTSSKTGVAGDSYNQTPVDFKHIFAAIQFSIGSSGLPNGTITKIILNNIQYKGTYSLDGTWTPNTTDKKSFSQTVSVSTNANTAITSGTTTFMMMPQTLNSDASITVSYSNGGTLTKAISSTWEAGKTYTYNLSKIIPVANFDYTGNVQTYTVPLTGTYKIECWGASGGNEASTYGGRGAYASGFLNLRNITIYVFVGGQGESRGDGTGTTYKGGFNGGGTTGYASGGGGATDIRLINGTWNDFNSLKSRIIVASAGTGADLSESGHYGGALIGTNGLGGDGGSQTAGGKGEIENGGFGYAGGEGTDGGGAGNGYYGGGDSNTDQKNGGSGSSFISGYPGCNAISESSTSTNIIHTGSPNHYSGYVFTNMEMIAGNSSMPAPSGGTEIGHSGNGYARITFVSAN